MNETQSVEGRLREFLVGAVSDTDRDQIEERLLVDDHLYELLIAAEEELLDEWARGSLDPQEARSFLGYLEKLPGGRARLDFAGLFATLTAGKEKQADSSAGGLLAAFRAGWLTARPAAWMTAACLLAALSVFFLFEVTSPIPRDAALPASDPPVLLTPGMTRGGGTLPVVAVSPGVVQELQLDLGADDFERYHAVLHDADATELFAASGLQPEATSERTFVVFAVPSDRLPPGDYLVSLYGLADSGELEPLSRYAFRAIGR